MSRRGRTLLVAGLLAGFTVSLIVIYGIASPAPPRVPRPPELGGQKVPEKIFDIQFDRSYDLFCSFYEGERTVYQNCTIVGFTGRGEESPQSGRSSRVGVFSSPSGSGSYSYERYFDHWLVLKLADGRRAYIPPGAIKYIEEAGTPKETEARRGEPQVQAR